MDKYRYILRYCDDMLNISPCYEARRWSSGGPHDCVNICLNMGSASKTHTCIGDHERLISWLWFYSSPSVIVRMSADIDSYG